MLVDEGGGGVDEEEADRGLEWVFGEFDVWVFEDYELKTGVIL